MGFYLRESLLLKLIPEVPEGEFHILKVVVYLFLLVPFIVLYVFGSEEAKPDEYEQKFAEIGLCGKGKSYPKLVKKEEKGNITELSFYSSGIDIVEWRAFKDRLETAMNCNLVKIERAPESKQIVVLSTISAQNELKRNIVWNNGRIKETDFVVTIGEDLLGEVNLDFNKVPHALIAGTTGSGKSVILRCILWQSIKKGATIYMVDFKGGVEFGTNYEQFGEVVTDRQACLDILKELVQENERRLRLFRETGVKNIKEYNEYYPEKPLSRIMLFCDEVSEMLDKTGLSSEAKVIYNEIEKEMSTIARLGRAPGINMILATQRPDAKVISGQIKNNLPIRICGRMTDPHASEIVLGNTKANLLDNIPGRFLYTVGADTYEFQAFNFDDRNLIPGNYQKGIMLINPDDEEREDYDYVLDEEEEEGEEFFDVPDEIEDFEGF